MDEWRTICPCQQHRAHSVPNLIAAGVTASTNRVRSLRSPYAALILSVPIAFGAVNIPGTEKLHVNPSERATVPAPIVPGSAPPIGPSPALVSPARDQRLHLITPVVRTNFLAERAVPDQYTLSLVKAEFFRNRVPYGSVIYREAVSNDLPPELVAAIVETESDFNKHLISNRNAVGLMQVVPETGALMGGGDLMDPAENVRIGTRYLRYLYRQFGGDTKMVLAAYNAGETAVRRYGGVPPYPETRNYLRRVASRRAWYQRAFERRVGHLFAVPQVDVPIAKIR